MINKTNTLIPELRFPEFVNNETWAERKLSDVLFEHKEKSSGKEEVYSVSVHKGVVNQIEHLGRVFASNNTENYKRVFPGDIIYTKSPTGDFPFGIIKQSKVLKPVITSPLYGVFKPETIDLGVILDAYFDYPERTINYLSSIIQKGAKNTVNIHNDIFLSKSLPLPIDKKEQQKIANCLSSLDELIISNIDKFKTLKTYKRGLIQNLFPIKGERVPKIRFKEFEKDGEWVSKIIENYIDLFSGIALKSNEISDNQSGIPILRGINITEGRIRHSKDIDKFYLGDLENLKRYLIKENDIVIGMDGSKVGKNVALIKKEDENSILIQRVARIRTKENTDIQFIYQHFRSNGFRDYVDRVNTSSGIPHISSQQIKDFKINFPPKVEEQIKIAETLSSLDDMIIEQSNKIEHLKSHKKGLMQGLFPNVSNKI